MKRVGREDAGGGYMCKWRLNKTSYLPPHGVEFPEASGRTRVLAWAGRWGGPLAVSGACPAAPGAESWLKTKSKACLINPVKAVITNKQSRFGELSWVTMPEPIRLWCSSGPNGDVSHRDPEQHLQASPWASSSDPSVHFPSFNLVITHTVK